MNSAIIGGSGCQHFIPASAVKKSVETAYGMVELYEDGEVIYLLRHAKGHTVPPHLINYRAHIEALRISGVHRVISLYAVGSITDALPPGSAGVLTDFIDVTTGRMSSFCAEVGDPFRHVAMDEPFSRDLNGKIMDTAEGQGIALSKNLTYVCTNGPRLETPGEIRMYGRNGCDVVGMTAATEVSLAHEAGIEIAGIAFSINWAAGVHSDRVSFIENDQVSEIVGKLTHLACESLREH